MVGDDLVIELIKNGRAVWGVSKPEKPPYSILMSVAIAGEVNEKSTECEIAVGVGVAVNEARASKGLLVAKPAPGNP
jgi:hypothetical protein